MQIACCIHVALIDYREVERPSAKSPHVLPILGRRASNLYALREAFTATMMAALPAGFFYARSDSEIGQAVHLVYLPNTAGRALEAADVDRLCELIGQRFPAATVQPAEAIYEGRRRSMLIVRIRTDSTDAVVDLAQRLCIAFDQQFVGVEVGGRYIRIYADDTA